MEFNYNGHSKDSGIYKLTNKLNGRVYYGSAKRFDSRWKGHEYSLKAGKGANKFLQADYNKCGSDAFIFEVLEVTTGTKEERLEIEERYLEENHDDAVNCYNFMKKANSREGCPNKAVRKVYKNKGIPRSEKDLEAIRAGIKKAVEAGVWNEAAKKTIAKRKESGSYKGRPMPEHVKQGLVESNTGRKCSEETKKKISDAQKGIPRTHKTCLGKKASDETRKKISEAGKGRKASLKTIALRTALLSKTWYLINPEGQLITIVNLAKFCREHGLKKTSARSLATGLIKEHKGWTCPNKKDF